MKSHRLRLLPVVALLLSILLHISLVLGDVAWTYWTSRSTDAAPLLLSSPTHKLSSQTIDLTNDLPAVLPGIHPVDTLMVRLGRPKPAAPTAKQVAHAAPAAKVKPKSRHAVAKAETPRPPAEQTAAEPSAEAGQPVTAVTSSDSVDAQTAAGDKSASSAQTADTAPATPSPTPQAPTPTPTSEATAAANTPSTEAPTSPRPTFDTTFPKSVDISYVFKGLLSADHRWRLHGSHYEISTKATVMGIGLFDLRSNGSIDQSGLRPDRFLEFHGGGSTPTYQVDFDWAASLARFGNNAFAKDAPLQPGAEDVFSAAYQFALQGDRLQTFNMQVFTGRKDYMVPFAIKGETKLTIGGQQIPVLLLAGTRETKTFEFYLAPGWHNLPVRIRYTDSEDGKDINLMARRISINGRTVLKPTSREMNN